MRVLLLVCVLVSTPVMAQDVGWSPGVVVTANLIGPEVSEAIIDGNGVVQSTVIRKTAIRPAVETHLAYPITTSLAVGPFVAAALGESIIEAIGGGLLVELNREGRRFNIGFGYWVAPRSRVLRGDFVVGQPAPPGATNVSYVEQTVASFAVLVGMPLP